METKNKTIAPEKFCYYPFTQLLLSPTGRVSPCCYQPHVILGQVPHQTIEEIWNGEPMQMLRREFLEGKPVLCEKQMRHIKCHLNTQMSVGNNDILLNEVQKQAPRRLDVRLNGRCNLSCVMCDVWTEPNGLYNSSDLWTYGPQKIFPFLVEIDVLGGEPFIQKDTYRLITEISRINEKCTWAFVTNASYHFNETLRKHLDRIQLRWMVVSIDSIRPDTYAKIRVNGQLDRTLKTMDDLIAYWRQRQVVHRGYGFSANMCVQKENWREIEEFIQFVKAKGISVGLQFAYGPDKVSLLTSSREERGEIVFYLEKLLGLYGEDIIRPILEPMMESLKV